LLCPNISWMVRKSHPASRSAIRSLRWQFVSLPAIAYLYPIAEVGRCDSGNVQERCGRQLRPERPYESTVYDSGLQLISRFGKIQMNSTIYGDSQDNIFYRWLVFLHSGRLKRNFRKKMQTLDSTLSVIVNTLQITEDRDLPHHRCLWNAAGYVNVCSYDLVTILAPSVFDRHKWHSRHQARQAAVLMYEACDDLPVLLGKKFRESLRILGAPDDMFVALNNARIPLDGFKNENSARLKDIRVHACAHRDHELSQQIRIIRQLDPMEMQSLSMRFDSILNDLGAYMQKTLTWSSKKAAGMT